MQKLVLLGVFGIRYTNCARHVAQFVRIAQARDDKPLRSNGRTCIVHWFPSPRLAGRAQRQSLQSTLVLMHGTTRA